jgi:hypothetical protein
VIVGRLISLFDEMVVADPDDYETSLIDLNDRLWCWGFDKNFPAKTIVLNAANIPEAMLSVHEFLALWPTCRIIKDWEAVPLRYSPTYADIAFP